MLRRVDFLGGIVTALVFGRAMGDAATASLPAGRPGEWVRYVMGSGVPYQKQIGFGIERTPLAVRPFVETQVGMPGGSCNPNTAKKAYLRGAFGTLLDQMPTIAYVSRSGTLTMLEEHDIPLRLLDSAHEYPASPSPSADESSSALVPEHASAHTLDAIAVGKRRVAARRLRFPVRDPFLRSFELWLVPEVPLGVARIHAELVGVPPFELALDSYGVGFATAISDSLDAVRAARS